MTKGETYKNTNDLCKIEFISMETHYMKTDGKQGVKKVKYDEPLLKFKYTESIVKKGEVEFKESEWERLVKQGMFVKI